MQTLACMQADTVLGRTWLFSAVSVDIASSIMRPVSCVKLFSLKLISAFVHGVVHDRSRAKNRLAYTRTSRSNSPVGNEC